MRLRRWWCEKRNHPGADMVVDEREFVFMFCPSCRTIKFTALADGVFTYEDHVNYYKELLNDYGFEG